MKTSADSSALVKLYADEEGHDMVRHLDVLVVSHLARVEVPAALWRKQRMGELSAEDAQVLTAEFEADWFGTSNEPPRFAAVVVTSGLPDQAAQLCARHGLRAYEAVQLSCALAARTADASCRPSPPSTSPSGRQLPQRASSSPPPAPRSNSV